MAKNKHFFGKFLAFTATAAAVGGACYVFRDKIKNSSLYKATLDKACDLYDKWKYRDFDDDEDGFEDFAFDDDDSLRAAGHHQLPDDGQAGYLRHAERARAAVHKLHLLYIHPAQHLHVHSGQPV